MAQDISGTGRVTIFPFLHDWETGSRCVLAYATTDNGDTAVMGVIPVEGNQFEPGDLFAMAGRHGFIGEWKGDHKQRCGCWLACMGSGARRVKKVGTIDVPAATWAVDMTRAVELDSAYYGHLTVVAGRFSLEDPELLRKAQSLVTL